MRRTSLVGASDAVPESLALRDGCWRSAASPPCMRSIWLEAFRRDVAKLRYRDWDDLMDYCRYSAMPVGRFVLDVHGESQDARGPSNDAPVRRPAGGSTIFRIAA